jgi:catechol 2,3-dioxygenase-like lactoylglutathione lyase family enzyme
MDWKLEVVVIPVADQDRAKDFYTNRVGFTLDVDHRAGDFRVVQVTPPGSACSVALMRNPDTAGTLQGLQVVVPDIEAARSELVDRGVAVSELFHFDQGSQVSGPGPNRADYETFCSFSDPDGNTWMVQEVPSRRAGS